MNFTDERQMKTTLGVNSKEFDMLLSALSREINLHKEACEKNYTDYRQRRAGGGKKSQFTDGNKLCICLLYLKTYPKFDDLAHRFNISRSKAHGEVHQNLPLLEKALISLGMMPARVFDNADELKSFFEKKRFSIS